MKAPGELWSVARCLGDILDEVVFVGGMIRELLITDSAAGPARPTQDVDCIVNAKSRGDYARLTERLRAREFSECTDEGAPLCRWVVRDVRVDVMPIDPAILGFSNVWYPSGLEHAIRIQGPDGAIRIVDAVHFCATKIEAFLGRGEGDFFHQDMEDLIAVIDGREELVAELGQAPKDVRQFVAESIFQWLSEERFVDALQGNLPGDAGSQARLPMLLARLREIGSLAAAQEAVTLAASLRRVAQATPVVPLPVPMPPWDSRASGALPLPTRVSLRSTNLLAAAYDAGTLVLTIEFQNGRSYVYRSVPANVYAGLLRAASHGRYFNQWIKDRYLTERLT